FEYFLTLLKHAKFMIGNSSAGIRESEVYGVPSIDIGSRQQGRYDIRNSKGILHVPEKSDAIVQAIKRMPQLKLTKQSPFGNGNSDELFIEILESEQIWEVQVQKSFISFENIV